MALAISDTSPRIQYTATGGQTAFTVPFEFFADADLTVIKTAASDGADTTLTLTSSPSSATQYSVTGAGVSGGGSITLGSGATVNDKYTISRNLAVSRTSDFPVSGTFPIETLNTELDKIIAMIQQNERDILFSPKAKISTSTAFNLTFPELVANKILTVNSAGNALEFSQSITDVATVAGIASDVTTVSGISSNVTAVAGNATNINAVAADATDIGAVAGKATEIGRLGTADAVADMAILGTADVVNDMNVLGSSATVTAMNLLGTSDVVSDMNTLATADIVSDMNTLATADVVADMNTLGTADVVSDMNTLATSDIVSDMNTLATSSNVTNMNTLAGISSDITTVAGISSAVSAVNSNATNINAVNSNSSNINTVAGISSNVTTVAGISSNVTTVAGNNSNVSTVASNITDVNTFANQYRIGSSDPTSSLDEGDLFYNTTSNVMKFYNGSAWVAISADTDTLVKVSSNDTTAGFLNGKLVAGSNISFTENSDGGNETLTIAGSTDVVGDTSPQLGGNLDVQTNSIISTSNRDIAVTPNGSGKVVLDGLNYPTADGTAGQFLKTDGSANLAFATVDVTNASSLSTGTLPNARLSSVPNSALANSAITINGSSTSLGGSVSIATGTSWQSTAKTSNFTAAASQGFFVNTSGGAITMTLPAGSVGAFIEVVDLNGTFNTNALTIAADGSEKIEGSTDNKIFDAKNGGLKLVYSGSTRGWLIVLSDTFIPSPTISGITGNILVGAASNLTLAGTNFGSSGLIIKFVQADDSINTTLTITPSSSTNTGAVAVPAAVYNNVTAGRAVSISVTNSDAQESDVSNKTALGLPTGGSITTTGDFRVHTFTSSGTFTNTITDLSLQYLVIAGGGGGSQSQNATGGGAGGAGGYRTSVPSATSGGGGSAESVLTLSTGDKTVTVGGGGGDRASGSDSVFDSITSTGGGHGGGYQRTGAASGGSGGGAAFQAGAGSGTSGQGFGGGSATTGGGGGGGGAGAVGGNSGGNHLGGNGGTGVESSINGSATTRAGGGGGGCHNGYGGSPDSGDGGAGGGGRGAAAGVSGGDTPQSGSGNTGGGGGGPIGNSSQGGASGGSGIVIVRYDLTSI
ncbi:MAG: putative tail fiber protein [Prokaryotic dsDNA virus sp.]|nr:MAG: putative tail fiber protein [Prokaryotic dsDNA virus sp.]|tara:strand:+ start:2100 stop:5396 length:3297 start_codon:yes stop_codon:yes gene_type:complete